MKPILVFLNSNSKEITIGLIVTIFGGIVVGIILNSLFSDDSKTPVNRPQPKQISNQEANRIVRATYDGQIYEARSLLKDNNSYVFGLVEEGEDNKLKKLQLIGGDWNEEDSDEIYCTGFADGCDLKTEFVNIDGEQYIFYTDYFAGNAIGTIRFNLMSVDQNEVFRVLVYGPHGKYENVEFQRLTSEPMKKFFESRISLSNNVYHPDGTEDDLSLPKNAIKKWNLENPSIHEKFEDGINEYNLFIPTYDESLFTFWDSTLVSSAENSTYKIEAYFKGPVLGFNKLSQKYFVIWVPKTTYDWASEVSFTEENILHVNHRSLVNDLPNINVDLKSGLVVPVHS